MVLGFEIEGSLNEVYATRLAKESVAFRVRSFEVSRMYCS